MAQVDKLIVTNLSMLRGKYGARWPRVQAALRGLIQADAVRGLTTRLVGLDDGPVLRRHGVSPVTDAEDYRGYKEAIDALWTAHRPDYVMILGAVDVVPRPEPSQPDVRGG